MKGTFRASIGILALALAGFASADGFSLKRIPLVGAAIKYTMTAKFTANQVNGTLTATLSEQVTDVDKDGGFTVQQVQIDGKGTYGEEDFDVPSRLPIKMTYKANRLLTKIDGDLIDVNSYRAENMATIVDPGKPVNIGDEWVGDIKADKTLGTPAVKFEYTLVGEEKIGDIDTLKIKGSAKEIEGVAPALHTFTMWISKADGAMIQLESTWENAPFPGVSSPVRATIKITKAPA